MTRRLIAAFTSGAARPVRTELDVLTDRERQVLDLVAEGLTNAEIGRRLYITPGTATVHVSRLLSKLDARDRVQLVIIAHRAGPGPDPDARRRRSGTPDIRGGHRTGSAAAGCAAVDRVGLAGDHHLTAWAPARLR